MKSEEVREEGRVNGHAVKVKVGGDVEVEHLPLVRIRHKPGDQFGSFNIRDDSELEAKKVEALAEQIHEQGLLEPLLVERVVEGSETWYDILAGNRRFAAMRLLKLRGTVPCIVKAPKSAADRILINAAENTSHEGLHPADLACRLAQMETGMYPGARELAAGERGEMPDAIPRARIALMTGLSPAYVGNLSRAWQKLCPEIRVAWRERRGSGNAISTDLAVAWSKLPHDEQQKAFDKWLANQKKKTAHREEKKAGKKGSGEHTVAPRKKSEVVKMLEKIEAKIEGPKLPVRELEIVEAKRSTLRWVLGQGRLTLS